VRKLLPILVLALALVFACGLLPQTAVASRGGVTPDNLPWNKTPSKKVTVTFSEPVATTEVTATGTTTSVTKIALVIGISDYSGTSSDLNYCDDDALECYNTLIQKYGFPQQNITLLLDSQATDANIRAGIDWLIANSGPGSSVVFYYSGHGSRSTRNMDNDPETQDECIIPWELSRLWDGELAAKFAQLTSTNNWICFDSCYSGGMTDIDANGEVVTMACGEKEYSYESSTIGHGYFTWLMIERGMRLGEADANRDGVVTVEEAFAFAAANIGAYASRQHPVIEDGAAGDLVP